VGWLADDARRLLAKLEAQKARNKAPDGLDDRGKFEPEREQPGGSAQRSGIRREDSGLEKDCGQVGFQISRRDALEGKAAIAIACPPPSGDTIDGSSRCRANNVRWIDFRRRRHGVLP